VVDFVQKKQILILIIILLVAAGWKAWLLLANAIPFNSDEAVVALMARHILAGERPVFFYGQAYMGSLDAYLVAGGFAIFGQEVWVIRLIQLFLYLGTIITTVWIGRVILGSYKTGLIAAGLLAIPTVNVTLYTTASLGGYGEALLIGNLILLLGYVLVKNPNIATIVGIQTAKPPFWLLELLFGGLIGLGLWTNGLTLIYSIPAGVFFLWSSFRNKYRFHRITFLGQVGRVTAGFLIGSLPWWIYAVQFGFNRLILELSGSAVAIENMPWWERVINHLIYLMVLGSTVIFGFRPPWEVFWLVVPLIPIVLAFWLAVLLFTLRKLMKGLYEENGVWFLVFPMVVLACGFIFTSFGVDPSGRYFVPLAIPLSLLASQMVQQFGHQIRWQFLIIGIIILYDGWGTWLCVQQNPPGLTTQFDSQTIIDHSYDQKLIKFLQSQGETTGYTNYWVAYPLAFQSGESLVFIPRLPYHLDLIFTPRDDRYLSYDTIVNSSKKVAYITTRNPQLDIVLEQQFQEHGVRWLERSIGDYHVFYDLSKVIMPAEMNLTTFSK
jgi:4-amino-4-deoxy-L-arabinose transferase-like glycosyltransferase